MYTYTDDRILHVYNYSNIAYGGLCVGAVVGGHLLCLVLCVAITGSTLSNYL